MNKDETKEAIKVMQAYIDGAEIEATWLDGQVKWQLGPPTWNFPARQYRVKKAPREFWVHPDYASDKDPERTGYIKVKEVI